MKKIRMQDMGRNIYKCVTGTRSSQRTKRMQLLASGVLMATVI